MIFANNKTYDALKTTAMIVIPALSALYATLGKIWGLPFTAEIPASLMALDTFFGVVLGYSSAQYGKQEATGDADLEAKDGE